MKVIITPKLSEEFEERGPFLRSRVVNLEQAKKVTAVLSSQKIKSVHLPQYRNGATVGYVVQVDRKQFAKNEHDTNPKSPSTVARQHAPPAKKTEKEHAMTGGD